MVGEAAFLWIGEPISAYGARSHAEACSAAGYEVRSLTKRGASLSFLPKNHLGIGDRCEYHRRQWENASHGTEPEQAFTGGSFQCAHEGKRRLVDTLDILAGRRNFDAM